MKKILELSDYIKPEMVVDLEVKDKTDLLDQLSAIIAVSDRILDPVTAKKALFDREKTMSTGIGNGIAIPHARTKAVSDFVIAVARIKTPIEYGSDDKMPVSLVFLILATDKQDSEYIQLLSRLVLRLRNKMFLKTLYDAKDSTAVYNLILNTK
jgi:mannitol/fructose-specific phosphotransferase system IIA component (Ntr-type)